MLEREPVTAAMRGTLERARAGHGAALFITGYAGLGKTACLGEACGMAAGMRAGAGRADPMEQALPFALMSQVLAGLGGPGLLDPPAGATPLDARIARFVAVLRWLQEPATGPVLLAADDLHWADPDSLALLSFVVRRISDLPVAVIATMRAWPSDAQEQAGALAQEGLGRLVRLEPLSVGAAGVLLAERSGQPLPAPVTERAWAACAGNPLLLEQLAVVLERGDDASVLLAVGGRGAGDRLMLARFAGLSPAGLAVVRAAAVLGGRFSAGLAGPVAGVAAADASDALDALARSGLVRSGAPGGLEFVHPLFRQALYDDTSPPLRARLHARAFEVLRARGLDEQACEHALPGELAGVAEAISLLESAGRADLARGALAAATGRLAAAVRLAGSHARPELLLAWGEASLWSGQLTDTVTATERVLARDDLAAPWRVQAHRMTATAHAAASAHEAAGLAYQQAFESAPPDQPDLAAAVLLEHALAVWLTAGPASAVPLAARARRIAHRASPRLQRRADVIWGFVALQAGDQAGWPLVEKAAAPLVANPAADVEDLLSGMGSTLVLYVMCANMARQPAAAQSAGAALIAAAEQLGAVQTLASGWVVHASTLYRLGNLPDALGYASQATGLADLIPMIEPYAAVGQAHVLLHLGRLDEAEQWCSRVEATAGPRGEWTALLFLCDARGQRLLREEDARAASDLYLQAEQITQRLGLREPCVVPWARHGVAAHTRSGRLADAERVTAWAEDCAQRLPCGWPRLAAAAGRALLAEAAGDRDRSEACYRRALGLHQELDLPLERIETLLDYGAMLRRSGHITRARSVLAEAGAAAEATDAAWLATLAHHELTLAGGRRRRPARSELTDTELRVARLASTGKTNAELSHQLSVSVNTIETHLRHIYAKLGVQSRAQLATRLTTPANEKQPAPAPAMHGQQNPHPTPAPPPP